MKRKLAGCCLKYLTDAVGTNAVGTVLLQLSYLQRRTTMQKSACWACGLLLWTDALQVPFDKQKCAGAQKIYVRYSRSQKVTKYRSLFRTGRKYFKTARLDPGVRG